MLTDRLTFLIFLTYIVDIAGRRKSDTKVEKYLHRVGADYKICKLWKFEK